MIVEKLCAKYPDLPFEQGSHNSSEFLQFAKSFKAVLNSQLKGVGAVLTTYSVGHFYLSGFFCLKGQTYYFSWHNGDCNLMYRTAIHDKDYTGGTNQWVRLQPGFVNKMRLPQ